MKKLFLALAILLMATGTQSVNAAVTGVEDPQYTERGFNDSDIEVTVVTLTGTTGSYVIKQRVCGWLDNVVTNPGATAPDDNYDVVFTDGDVVDVMGGELANRDTSTSEQAMPKKGNGYGPRYICNDNGDLTITVSNQTQAGAIMEFIFYVF